MALKKKEDQESLPQKLQTILKDAFSLQGLRDGYKKLYDKKSGDLKDYFLENDDGFDITTGAGAGFKCDQGSIKITQGKEYETDADKIIELVESGKITLTSLLGAVTYRQTDLKTVLGSHYEKIVTSSEKTDAKGRAKLTVTLTANSEFKAKVAESMGEVEVKPKAVKPVKEKPVEKPKPKKKVSSIAAQAKAASLKTADSDLDDILGGD